MLRGKDVEEINQLKREGLSILAISNLTAYDRETIRKYLLEPTAKPEYPPRPKPVGKLEPFKAYLGERLQAGVWNAPSAAAGTAVTQLYGRLYAIDGLAASAA